MEVTVVQQSTAVAAMASRAEEMTMNSDSDKREYTIILAGKLGVGKTSIFRRIQTGVYTEYPAVSTGKSGEGELENYIYRTTLDGMDYTVSTRDIRYTALIYTR